MTLQEQLDVISNGYRTIKVMGHTIDDNFTLPIYMEIFRGDEHVARVCPLVAQRPSDIEPVLNTAVGSFGADTAFVVYETVMVPTEDWRISMQHPVTGEVLSMESLAGLLAVEGHRTGLLNEALVCAGANRAGELVVRLDWFVPGADRGLTWHEAPQPEDLEAEYGDTSMVLALRRALTAGLTLSEVVTPAMFGEKDMPQERVDVLVAVWLQRMRHCRVQLLSAREGDERGRALRRWAQEDWQWDGVTHLGPG